MGQTLLRASQGALVVKNPSASTGDVRDLGSIRGWGQSPGEGHSHPRQCSCPESPVDRGAWWAGVQGVTESNMTEATQHAHSQTLLQVRGGLEAGVFKSRDVKGLKFGC